MQRLRQFVKMLLLLILVLVGSGLEVNAEQLNSVKDCIENPENCSENQLVPDNNAESTNTSKSSVGLTIWDFLKMIMATIFVIALLYFLLKFINKKSHVYRDNQVIQNIGGTSLGGNRSVQIIKVGERVLVVGVGENIQLLKEIEDEEEARQIIIDYNNKMDQLMGPSDIVTKVFKRAKTFHIPENERENASFPSILKRQLDNISSERKKLYDEMEKKGSDER